MTREAQQALDPKHSKQTSKPCSVQFSSVVLRSFIPEGILIRTLQLVKCPQMIPLMLPEPSEALWGSPCLHVSCPVLHATNKKSRGLRGTPFLSLSPHLVLNPACYDKQMQGAEKHPNPGISTSCCAILCQSSELRSIACTAVGWAGLGWAGLSWAGLGWAGLGWAELGWAGLGWARCAKKLLKPDEYW